ncbi:hypothetical protein, partial [Cloacibacillus evryensis]|uniref:hypothetical protein n=1 Tax=Cloacibacillus evryensis TaxID=508460 RepID=UPI003A856D41
MYNRTNEDYNKKATTVNRQTSPVFIFYENILLKSSPSFPTAALMDPLRAFCQAAERLLGPFTYLRARYFPPRAQKCRHKKLMGEFLSALPFKTSRLPQAVEIVFYSLPILKIWSYRLIS